MSDQEHKNIEQTLDIISAKLDEVLRAFPGGDIDGHRRAHEAMIEAANAEKRFWTELKLDIAKKGTFGLVMVLVGLVIAGAAVKLGFGSPR